MNKHSSADHPTVFTTVCVLLCLKVTS